VGDALRAVTLMQQGRVVDLDARLALLAARLNIDARLPMADSVVLAIARLHEAVLWTQDADFEPLPGVRYRATADLTCCRTRHLPARVHGAGKAPYAGVVGDRDGVR
jgi:hypothetical protein